MTTAPTFAQAKAFRLLFGMKGGATLDDVATNDRGLLYLDWLRGELERAPSRSTRQQVTLDNLQVYLADPTIAQDVSRAVSQQDDR